MLDQIPRIYFMFWGLGEGETISKRKNMEKVEGWFPEDLCHDIGWKNGYIANKPIVQKWVSLANLLK